MFKQRNSTSTGRPTAIPTAPKNNATTTTSNKNNSKRKKLVSFPWKKQQYREKYVTENAGEAELPQQQTSQFPIPTSSTLHIINPRNANNNINTHSNYNNNYNINKEHDPEDFHNYSSISSISAFHWDSSFSPATNNTSNTSPRDYPVIPQHNNTSPKQKQPQHIAQQAPVSSFCRSRTKSASSFSSSFSFGRKSHSNSSNLNSTNAKSLRNNDNNQPLFSSNFLPGEEEDDEEDALREREGNDDEFANWSSFPPNGKLRHGMQSLTSLGDDEDSNAEKPRRIRSVKVSERGTPIRNSHYSPALRLAHSATILNTNDVNTDIQVPVVPERYNNTNRASRARAALDHAINSSSVSSSNCHTQASHNEQQYQQEKSFLSANNNNILQTPKKARTWSHSPSKSTRAYAKMRGGSAGDLLNRDMEHAYYDDDIEDFVHNDFGVVSFKVGDATRALHKIVKNNNENSNSLLTFSRSSCYADSTMSSYSNSSFVSSMTNVNHSRGGSTSNDDDGITENIIEPKRSNSWRSSSLPYQSSDPSQRNSTTDEQLQEQHDQKEADNGDEKSMETGTRLPTSKSLAALRLPSIHIPGLSMEDVYLELENGLGISINENNLDQQLSESRYKEAVRIISEISSRPNLRYYQDKSPQQKQQEQQSSRISISPSFDDEPCLTKRLLKTPCVNLDEDGDDDQVENVYKNNNVSDVDEPNSDAMLSKIPSVGSKTSIKREAESFFSLSSKLSATPPKMPNQSKEHQQKKLFSFSKSKKSSKSKKHVLSQQNNAMIPSVTLPDGCAVYDRIGDEKNSKSSNNAKSSKEIEQYEIFSPRPLSKSCEKKNSSVAIVWGRKKKGVENLDRMVVQSNRISNLRDLSANGRSTPVNKFHPFSVFTSSASRSLPVVNILPPTPETTTRTNVKYEAKTNKKGAQQQQLQNKKPSSPPMSSTKSGISTVTKKPSSPLPSAPLQSPPPTVLARKDLNSVKRHKKSRDSLDLYGKKHQNSLHANPQFPPLPSNINVVNHNFRRVPQKSNF